MFFSKPVALKMVHVSCTNGEGISYNTVMYLTASSTFFLNDGEALPVNSEPCKDSIPT